MVIDKYTILVELSNLINTPLSDINKLTKPRQHLGWTDSVEQYINKYNYDTSFYQPPVGDSISDLIHRRLGHIILSPNDLSTTKALVDSYDI